MEYVIEYQMEILELKNAKTKKFQLIDSIAEWRLLGSLVNLRIE